ncbi:MAG: ArnT family glycosyltransferase [Christensenellales bacterium]
MPRTKQPIIQPEADCTHSERRRGAMDTAIFTVRTVFILLAAAVYAIYEHAKFQNSGIGALLLGAASALLFAGRFILEEVLDRRPCDNDTHRAEKSLRIFDFVSIAVLLGGYAAYLLTYGKEQDIIHELCSSLCLILFTVLGLVVIPGIVRTLCGRNQRLCGKRVADRSSRFWTVVLIALGIRIVTTFAGMLIYRLTHEGFGGGLFRLWQEAWSKGNTDANHYLNIAENWYVAEGNDKLLIVFFPLFPLLIRALSLIIPNSFISAQILNTIFTCFAAGMLYKLICEVLSESKAFLSSIIFLLLPGAVFMNSTMTEPLFVLLTCTSLYFMRKKSYLLAGLFAALSGFTRSVGILLIVPIAIEGIGEAVYLLRNKQKAGGTILRLVGGLGISCTGTGAYLLINKLVTGNAFMFSVYQKSNWSQSIGYFFDTPRYMYAHAAHYAASGNYAFLLVFALPTLAVIFASLIIYLNRAKRLPASFNAYFLAYFVIAIGCTWLLSAVRYICVLVPFIAAIALLPKKKAGECVTIGLCAVMYCAYMCCYMLRYSVF